MKRLIINSDDYGRTPEISRGIREAHLRGVVTSTTCMMNIPTTAADIADALKETPELGMGVHLVLTMGSPISAPVARIASRAACMRPIPSSIMPSAAKAQPT